MRKIDKLIKKVEALNSSATLFEIESEIESIYKNNYDAKGKLSKELDNAKLNKLDNLQKAKDLLILENKKEVDKQKKFLIADASQDLFYIMQDNISYYKNRYSYTDIINQMLTCENQKGYINAIKSDKKYNILNFNDLQKAFKIAYDNIKSLHIGNINYEKEQVKQKQKRQKQRLVNNLYTTALVVMLDKWANKRARRW